MIVKVPPCPGRAKLGASPAVNANKAVKDHLFFGQTVETEQTQSLLSSDKHQVILLTSHFCTFQLGKSLHPRADKRSRTWGASECQISFFQPTGTRKYHSTNHWERDRDQHWLSKSSLNFREIQTRLWILWLLGMAFALGNWMKVKPSCQWASFFNFFFFNYYS